MHNKKLTAIPCSITTSPRKSSFPAMATASATGGWGKDNYTWKPLTDPSAASPCTSVRNKPNVTETDTQSAQLLSELKAQQRLCSLSRHIVRAAVLPWGSTQGKGGGWSSWCWAQSCGRILNPVGVSTRGTIWLAASRVWGMMTLQNSQVLCALCVPLMVVCWDPSPGSCVPHVGSNQVLRCSVVLHCWLKLLFLTYGWFVGLSTCFPALRTDWCTSPHDLKVQQKRVTGFLINEETTIIHKGSKELKTQQLCCTFAKIYIKLQNCFSLRLSVILSVTKLYT